MTAPLPYPDHTILRDNIISAIVAWKIPREKHYTEHELDIEVRDVLRNLVHNYSKLVGDNLEQN